MRRACYTVTARQPTAIVTTEAGLLPLYSEWRAINAWGLNDARIVREGGITKTYLSEINPDTIVVRVAAREVVCRL